MTDKRRQPRFEVCLTARWQGCPAHYDARIADLSEGGCYVDTIAEVSEKQYLFLEIMLPDGRWLKLQGIVAHHFPRLGFGVQFVNLDEQQRRQVLSLLPGGTDTLSSFDQSSKKEDQSARESEEPFLPFDQVDLASRRIM
jgi:hypothetical protein